MCVTYDALALVKTTTGAELPNLLDLVPSLNGGHTTKQDYVASLLREAIVTAKLAPGQRLRQEQISLQLGLSWTPVREAFRQLEAEGWLVIAQHRGAVVAPLLLQDFEDIYLLRLANEPLAARLSAERVDAGTLRAVRRLDARMRQLDLGRSADWVRFLRLEREFHATLYRAAGRPRLFDLVMSLRHAAERYLRSSFAIADEPLHHQRVHTELLAASRTQDGAAAEDIMRHALERVLTRMRPLLARVLDRSGGTG